MENNNTHRPKGNRGRKNKIREVQALKQGTGSSKLKKKIRDVERTLRKPGLAATKKIESERALVALKDELEQVRKGQQAKENAQKYHMVRFFERKKATRKLKQIVKAVLKDQENIADTTISIEDLKKLQKAEVDLYYVVKFPFDKKYISLYPTSDANEPETKRARQEFWEELQAEVKSGSLPSGIHPKKNESKALFEVERIRKQSQIHQEYQQSGRDEKEDIHEADGSHDAEGPVDGEDDFFV